MSYTGNDEVKKQEIIEAIEDVVIRELKRDPDPYIVAEKVFREVIEGALTEAYADGYDDGVDDTLEHK